MMGGSGWEGWEAAEGGWVVGGVWGEEGGIVGGPAVMGAPDPAWRIGIADFLEFELVIGLVDSAARRLRGAVLFGAH